MKYPIFYCNVNQIRSLEYWNIGFWIMRPLNTVFLHVFLLSQNPLCPHHLALTLGFQALSISYWAS